jgi:shikimate kinase
MEQRYPVYALADITIDSRDVLHDVIVDEVVTALLEHLKIPVVNRDAQS